MNDLKGKKILFLGDSITEGVGASSYDKCYVSVFEKISGMVVKNYGISGTRIAKQTRKSNPESFDLDFIQRVDDMDSDADYVVVFGGTNDFGHGDAPFGKFEDCTNETFYGAVHALIQKLTNKYPFARIIFMSSMHRLSEDVTTNEIGLPCKPLIEYVKAEKEVCSYYSIPVIDLWNLTNIHCHNEKTMQLYMPDGCHPSDIGHERIAKIIYNQLLNL